MGFHTDDPARGAFDLKSMLSCFYVWGPQNSGRPMLNPLLAGKVAHIVGNSLRTLVDQTSVSPSFADPKCRNTTSAP